MNPDVSFRVIALFVVALLSGSAASAQILSTEGPSGGDGGVEFEERALPAPGLTLPAFGTRVRDVRICSGVFVDSIQLTWRVGTGAVTGVRHGGGGGRCRTHTLADDERIVSISGRYGRVVDSIVITTNRRRAVPIVAGGAGGAAPFAYSVPSDGSITALIGRSGDYVDAVGIIIGK
jgi:hypothetical protein